MTLICDVTLATFIPWLKVVSTWFLLYKVIVLLFILNKSLMDIGVPVMAHQ